MSDLKLVSPDQPTAFEQQLLDAVANEAPSTEQRTRVRLALGLAAVAPAPVPAAPLGRRALLLKAAGGVIVASTAVAVLLWGLGNKSHSSTRPAAALVTQAAPSAPLPTAVPALEASAASAPAHAAVAAVDAVEHNNVPSKRAKKPATVDSAGDLSEQLRLIDAARAAVAAGNPAAASAALSSYRTRFARGPFAQEAAVLQIETLDLQGNHAQAAAQAQSFLARHPNSPHVGVVQRIAGH
ncbi:MAG TPA: outer membrane protein assembly factor BamD [Polyangiaceae bacterium]